MNHKKILRIEHPRNSHMVGDGFRVSQYIPGYGREMSPESSPFLMLDYNYPWIIPPQKNHRPGVGFHPHRGFETVTIVYSGEIEHKDTAGNGGVIGPDEVQWMTAGSGLLHNEFMTERFSQHGGMQHAVQLWVDLPREYKMTPPRYQALTRENIPEIKFAGGMARIIAGDVNMEYMNEGFHQKGIAQTHSPIELYDIALKKDNTIYLSFQKNSQLKILIVEGEGIIDNKKVTNGDMATFSLEGELVEIMSTHDNTRLLIMAGIPLNQSVVQHGPFVMNTDEEITQAWIDFHSGKMGNLG